MASAPTRAKKVTVTLDAITKRHLADVAVRLGKPKSEIVREAVNAYHSRLQERDRMLKAIDDLRPPTPPRPRAEIDRELLEIRRARGHRVARRT